jgi:hypothetical protein
METGAVFLIGFFQSREAVPKPTGFWNKLKHQVYKNRFYKV